MGHGRQQCGRKCEAQSFRVLQRLLLSLSRPMVHGSLARSSDQRGENGA